MITHETVKQQNLDSDMIFTQISTSDFEDFDMANRAVCAFYIPDMAISRSGISLALKRLEKFYKEKNKCE